MQDDEVYKRKEQILYKTITISLHQDNLGGYVWCFEEQAWRATLSVFFCWAAMLTNCVYIMRDSEI